MTRHYSVFSLIKEGFANQKGWQPAWRSPEPKPKYDAIVIGGGGHGLATAWFLASRFAIANVAVVEKGWIGSGNAGRNTTIIRSNYELPGNIGFYELSMKLWETMEQDLNYNTMVSQRSVSERLPLAPRHWVAAALASASRWAIASAWRWAWAEAVA